MSSVVTVAPANLDALASRAGHAHQRVMRAGGEMVAHAVEAGEALLAAREQVPAGGWIDWLEKHFPSTPATANAYMRVAWHKEHLPSEARSLNEAMLAIRGLPSAVEGTMTANRYADDLKQAAKRLHRQGVSGKQIAERLGVSGPTISNWVNGSAKQRQRDKAKERRQAKKDAARRVVDAQMRKSARPEVSEVYFLLRKAAQALDRLRTEDSFTPEQKTALNEALYRCNRAESRIVEVSENIGRVTEGVLR